MNERITLLSAEEHEKYESIITLSKDSWWLRTPSHSRYCVHSVYHDSNNINDIHLFYEYLGVRPVLIIPDLEAKAGDKIERFNYAWTVLDSNLALCDSIIEFRYFDECSNKWESSELKAWLEDWLQTMQSKESTKLLGEPIMVKTPLGEICAKEIPDNDFPGIALTFTGTDGEPGAILEYDCVAKCIQLRIYSKEDPDGEPAAIFKMS